METPKIDNVRRLRDALETNNAQLVADIVQPMLPAGVPKLINDQSFLHSGSCHVNLGREWEGFWTYEFEVCIQVDRCTKFLLNCDLESMVFCFLGIWRQFSTWRETDSLFRYKRNDMSLEQAFEQFSKMIMEHRTKPTEHTRGLWEPDPHIDFPELHIDDKENEDENEDENDIDDDDDDLDPCPRCGFTPDKEIDIRSKIKY
jgi:hypothetical protein